MSSPGHATTPVAAAQSQAPSMTSFASANTYHTLDNAMTDDESANLLTAPELPVDLPTMVFPVEDVDLNAPELLDIGGPPIDPGDGNAISTALRRLDEKWTTILTTYNDNLEEKHAYDVEQCRYDEENRDEQRRRDCKEQRLINTELCTVKRLDFEALLASSKDAFATELKATFDGFRLELSNWKTSINDSMARNTTTLQAEVKAAIDTPAAISLKATVNGLMDTVPTFMQEMRATVSALSETVKSLDDRVIRSHGHFTKTILPSLSSRLDILEERATQVPRVLAEEPPPSLSPEPTVAPPPAALPVVLPSDPPDDSVTPTPRVPAKRIHHLAPQTPAKPGFPWIKHGELWYQSSHGGYTRSIGQQPHRVCGVTGAYVSRGSQRDHRAHRRHTTILWGNPRDRRSQPPCPIDARHVRTACYTTSVYPLPTLQSVPNTYHS